MQPPTMGMPPPLPPMGMPGTSSMPPPPPGGMNIPLPPTTMGGGPPPPPKIGGIPLPPIPGGGGPPPPKPGGGAGGASDRPMTMVEQLMAAKAKLKVVDPNANVNKKV